MLNLETSVKHLLQTKRLHILIWLTYKKKKKKVPTSFLPKLVYSSELRRRQRYYTNC